MTAEVRAVVRYMIGESMRRGRPTCPEMLAALVSSAYFRAAPWVIEQETEDAFRQRFDREVDEALAMFSAAVWRKN